MQLFSDHLLFAPRGVNRTSQKCASNLSSCPSIQPWMSAVSIASTLPTLADGAVFFASFSQAPADIAPFSTSHSFQAA
jgi:hypothetical protein